MLRLLTVQNFI